MPTPKFDKMCMEFVKRIPDQLEDNTFVAGTGALPRSFLLSAEVIIDYINRGLQKFFETQWIAAKADIQTFINMFPELQRVSEDEALTDGEFDIDDPYLDFFKIIGAFTYDPDSSVRTYIKPKAESLYTHYKAGKYKSFQATVNDPAIIQVFRKLAVFPPDVTDFIIFHYIKFPLNPETGEVLTQNGDYDSPYAEQWHKPIVDIAYGIWQEETVQTTQ